jgi:predicted acyltransferase
MGLVPVPGYGVGRLDIEGNLAAYLDRWLMLGHLWRPTWDPEGVLSTFPAVATTLLRTLVGQWLLWDGAMSAEEAARLSQGGSGWAVGGPKGAKAVGMLAMGAAGLALGQLWHLWFPINKNLWTSSYVVFTAGFALVLLGLCYWAVEVQGYRRWAAPFLIFGANSIASFTASSLMAKMMEIWKVPLPSGRLVSVKAYLYLQFFAPVAGPKNASLLFALSYVVFWLGLMGILYRRKIFIKI